FSNMVQMDIDGLPSSSNEEYVADGLECVSLKFVRNVNDIATAEEYAPEYVYQHFGDSEKIFGYKNISVSIVYSEVSMRCYPIIKYDKKINEAKEGVKADDILKKLKDQLPEEQMEMQVESEEEMRAILAKEDNFKPFGELMSKFSSGGKDFEIYRIEELNDEFSRYLTRVQTLALWYINAAEYTDTADDKWMHYLVYEARHRTDGVAGNTYALAGYCSLYQFYGYPEKIRPRIAQILLLPLYRACGIGASFLNRIYKDLATRKEVMDVTAEDPADGFLHLRNYVEATNLSSLPEFAPEKLKEGFSEEMYTAANKAFKTNKNQCRRIYEILRLRSIGKKDEAELKKYRLDVKRRLDIPMRRTDKDWKKINAALDEEEISQVAANTQSVEEKMKTLQQMYEKEIEVYQTTIDRMEKYPRII
ncbi:hypothetical protein PFISCL1PPCAC_10011, partial [Pristionchus fissidentatus]